MTVSGLLSHKPLFFQIFTRKIFILWRKSIGIHKYQHKIRLRLLRNSIAISYISFISNKIDSIFERISEFLFQKKYFWVHQNIISNKNVWKIVFGLLKLINWFFLIKKLFRKRIIFDVLFVVFSQFKPKTWLFQDWRETWL